MTYGVRKANFQTHNQFNQTVFCCSYNYFFAQVTAHSSFFKSHGSTKHKCDAMLSTHAYI